MGEKKELKDFYGRILGTIWTDESGKQTIRDFYGVIKGYYDPKDDTTRDFYGRVVGKGNLLTTLL